MTARTHSSEASAILACVTRSLDALIAASQPYHGLFPSLPNRQTGQMLADLPPGISGQRDGDRSHLGSNLIHDHVTLKTMYALAAAIRRPDYAVAADAYLQRFAAHCTNTPTGLFPWGEHSFWHLLEDSVGDSYRDPARKKNSKNAIHDHLRQAPLWLWEKLWQFNPRCVERFAEGLDFHWQAGKQEEYMRHAYIGQRVFTMPQSRSFDFPRHSGFYILDWAFAWTKTGRADFLRQLDTMLDYWWDRRDARGLLRIESRSPLTDLQFFNINSPGQTISLAASLLESAAVLAPKQPEIATVMRERAIVYINGFFAAPSDLTRGVFALSTRCDDNALVTAMPIWGSKYGVWPASYVALTCLCIFRFNADPRLLEWAQAVGRCYLREAFPAGVVVPSMDAGLALGLMAELYALTGDTAWRDGSLRLAATLTATYCDASLPRGAAGIDWYESQMGPGFLLHGLARTALLATDRADCALDADFTAR